MGERNIGMLSLGLKNLVLSQIVPACTYHKYRIGYNSERNIRGPIQNGFHDRMGVPHFRVLSLSDKLYYEN